MAALPTALAVGNTLYRSYVCELLYRSYLPQVTCLAAFALHYAFKGSYVPAAWLVFLGAAFDKMDGKIARVMGKDSLFGIQFDSIVDICTFGFVPAVIMYQGYLTELGIGTGFRFVLCGAIRPCAL